MLQEALAFLLALRWQLRTASGKPEESAMRPGMATLGAAVCLSHHLTELAAPQLPAAWGELPWPCVAMVHGCGSAPSH